MKRLENESTEEQRASDGLDSSDTIMEHSSGDSDVTTTEPVPDPAEEAVIDNTQREDTPDADASLSMEPLDADDESDTLEAVGGRGLRKFSREQIWTAVAFGLVILIGAILRFWGLGTKPLHHDESLHAYFSMILLHNNVENWWTCASTAASSCYRYDPLTHGPFQFHIIAFVYKISQILGVADNGINTTTVRIAAASLGTLLVALPYFIRDYLGKVGAWLACFLLAVSPSLVYYSRFAREDIYMACFTLLMVVAMARYVRTRKMGWLITAAIAFTLSYATKESTFLVIGIFGSFMGALIVWELGIRKRLGSAQPPVIDHLSAETGDNSDLPSSDVQGSATTSSTPTSSWSRLVPRTAAPLFVLVYFVVLGIFAKWFLGVMGDLSRSITASTASTHAADLYVAHLKQVTQLVLPWVGIALALFVFGLLLWEQFGHVKTERHGIAARIDPKKQPLLDTIFTMPWTHWFLSLVIGWFLFMALFTVLFTNTQTGIGDGIWQGLYYWLQQQQVARGGQPWFYYFLLIPLYEQIGVVFGLAGVVYCLVRPTRLRLFLVYWFLGNLLIYTWAGEKMPWLTIHITMPMMILAAIALQPSVLRIWAWLKQRFNQPESHVSLAAENASAEGPLQIPAEFAGARPHTRWSLAGTCAIIVCALLLLVPTLQNMFQLSYIHQADAPHEMMIYVQTSTDINIVMDKIQQIDQKMYGGHHAVPIGITSDTTWPFAWYVRDYTNVCFNYPDGCSATAKSIPIILGSGNDLLNLQQQDSTTYAYHQYHMRTQWDQGYMPPLCVKSATDSCSTPQPYVGVGPWLWLSYGDNPPKDATFNLARAAYNIWQWWWYRVPFGSVDGSYDMGLFINNSVVTNSGVRP